MMKKSTVVERIAKAEEFIAKKSKTRETKSVRAAKKENELLDKYGIRYEYERARIGYMQNVQEMGFSREEANTIFWLVCDIDNLHDDNKQLTKDIKEKEEKLREYKEQLAEVEAFEETLAKEVPEAFKEARKHLVERWTEWDIEARDKMRAYKAEVSYHEFYQRYKYSQYESLNKSDDELRKDNEREADLWLVDLYNRVKEVTGTVTDTGHIYFRGKALNGLVIGEKGTARVETIGAGGWNIQKYHLRVLVHKYVKEVK